MLIFGLGYSGTAVARAAAAAGWDVTGTSREPSHVAPPPGTRLVAFDAAGDALAAATHLLATAAPGDEGDPVLARYGDAIRAAPARWAGYLSTTGVYGDRGGGWVDETTPPAPGSDRSRRRLAAEEAWRAAFGASGRGRALDLFRLAGIYGPGRSALDDVRAGTARRIAQPGHLFGRIHRADIAAAVLAAIGQDLPPGVRVLNLSDDEPAANADVVAEAARLLGAAPPPLVPYVEAERTMSAMARSFWAENRRVRSEATQRTLELRWRYPTYREGLAATLAEEAEQGGAQQGEVRRA
ncbi:MAG: SDR family NAD(P)-dependent oxidoreductase [Acetobacteraceae bacterium]|nr:SDR family NAD(P)-dependent oxidoreductase [Acetobacteraceae bacterium]